MGRFFEMASPTHVCTFFVIGIHDSSTFFVGVRSRIGSSTNGVSSAVGGLLIYGLSDVSVLPIFGATISSSTVGALSDFCSFVSTIGALFGFISSTTWVSFVMGVFLIIVIVTIPLGSITLVIGLPIFVITGV